MAKKTKKAKKTKEAKKITLASGAGKSATTVAKTLTAAPTDWAKYFAELEAERAKSLKTALSEVNDAFEDMHMRGITEITCSYSGEGDSGQMDYIHYEKNPAFGEKTPEDLPDKVQKAVENIAWKLIPSGFENNDGGFGDVIFNLKQRKITLRHHDRIVETEETEEEYNFEGEKEP